MAEVLMALANCIADVDFSVKFKVKDQEKVKDQLLKEAVKNSAKRAEILAEAAGVKLGKIQDINYNWGEINVYSNFSLSRRRMESMDLMAKEVGEGIEPDEIETSDTVTIRWELVS